eukprot:CAMPEP_0194199778 /NCGR_PEP_ID=MMETSP0156-20130528/665_1 /TAXON_ID=33649 /ORGANISM="Thalassionema nitzschioides, Strain L26-B" /LENGTH=157 /DNA_ID=CAMNT_0038924715 /DNA_START=93 /DNA_END=566 /DNA_ORIENTATION=+
MNSSCIYFVLFALAATYVAAFSGSFGGSKLSTNVANSGRLSMEYIPSGMSKAQWQKMKEAEKNKTKGKNLGKVGITSFKSRSFADWQKSGGKNLFPVDPNSVKTAKEIPYMQRSGGSADDADLKKGGGGNFFANLFGKKEKAEPAPEPEKKKNPWTF